MPAGRLLALALLALAAAMTGGSLLLPADCDDACPPHCGDCLACGLVADVAGSTPPGLGLAPVGVVPSRGDSRLSVSARLLDHVPLPPPA
jgi:hypothetical protein